jgi:hypothetical protein
MEYVTENDESCVAERRAVQPFSTVQVMIKRKIQTYISPSFTEDKLDGPSIDDVVDVFEDRIQNWVLEPAKRLVADNIHQVAGFCILLTYFEGIWPYVRGQSSRGPSRRSFVEAFSVVFRSGSIPKAVLEEVAGVLYVDARCGIFHDGMFRDHVFFGRLDKGEMRITTKKGRIESIVVDAPRFWAAVERHFKSFVAVLRDTASVDERRRFYRVCKDRWDWDGDPRVIGMANPTVSVRRDA